MIRYARRASRPSAAGAGSGPSMKAAVLLGQGQANQAQDATTFGLAVGSAIADIESFSTAERSRGV